MAGKTHPTITDLLYSLFRKLSKSTDYSFSTRLGAANAANFQQFRSSGIPALSPHYDRITAFSGSRRESHLMVQLPFSWRLTLGM
jgi:hypothetical protein